jgi:hypothetical protein
MTSSWVSGYKVPRVDYSMALLRNRRLGSIGAGRGVLGCGGGQRFSLGLCIGGCVLHVNWIEESRT